MEQKAAFFDVDGTLTTSNVWRGMMAYFKSRKLRRGTHCLFIATHYPIYLMGWIGLLSKSQMRSVWARDLAWYFRKFDKEQANKIFQWVAKEYLEPYMRIEVVSRLTAHLQSGDIVVLVSSGLAPQIAAIGELLGVKHIVGTEPEYRHHQYTGRVAGPVCSEEKKAEMTKAYLSARGIKVDFNRSWAYADSISDQALLSMVGNPVVVSPDEKLRRIAQRRGWTIWEKNGNLADQSSDL